MLIYYFFVQIKRKHYVNFIRQTGLNSKESFDDYLFAKISKLLRSIYCFKMYFFITFSQKIQYFMDKFDNENVCFPPLGRRVGELQGSWDPVLLATSTRVGKSLVVPPHVAEAEGNENIEKRFLPLFGPSL